VTGIDPIRHKEDTSHMGRLLGTGLGLVLVGALTVGTAAAAPSDEAGKPAHAKPTTVAIATGQLVEDDGGRATLDLRAHSDGQKAGGALRFYSASDGYYSGAVKTLSVSNGAITASGGGGLIKPDGTRVPVKYTATISADGSKVDVEVTGKAGFHYALVGKLDGFVKAGDPAVLAPKTKPAKK
jgi:hypothetical protein